MELAFDTSSATRVAEQLRSWLESELTTKAGVLRPNADPVASVFIIGSCSEPRIPEATWQDFDLHFAFDAVYLNQDTLRWVREFLDSLKRLSNDNCAVDATVRDRHWKMTPLPSVPNNIGVHATVLSRADHLRRVSIHSLLADNMYHRCRLVWGVHPRQWQERRRPTYSDYLHSVGGLGWLSENLARAATLHLLNPDDHEFAPFVGGYCWNVVGAALFHLYTLETGGISGRHGGLTHLRGSASVPDHVLDDTGLVERHRLVPAVDAATATELYDAAGRVLGYVGDRILARLGFTEILPAWEGCRPADPRWAAQLKGQLPEAPRLVHVCRDEQRGYLDGIRAALDQARRFAGTPTVGAKEWPEFLRDAVQGGPLVKVQVWDRLSRLRLALSHDHSTGPATVESAVFGWEDGAQALLQRLTEWAILDPDAGWLEPAAATFATIARHQFGAVGAAMADATTVDGTRRALAETLGRFLARGDAPVVDAR